MGLGDKQRLFMKLIAKLIIFAYEEGYMLSLGDGYRDPRVFGEVGEKEGYGRSNSLHKQRLAIDLNLFEQVNGSWLYLKETNDHLLLGEYWESLHELCSWGGRFNDGNHYSLTHEGKR